jgi:DNA-binding MarR family transcriptional regulator
MDALKDLREVMGCPCLRIRRASRHITQLYDHVLAEVGLTANQFGLLAYLFRATTSDCGGLSIGSLAEQAGVDPTTLNRNLKPLEAKGLIADAPAAPDNRVRVVSITKKGRMVLQKALPLWRKARKDVEKALGAPELSKLNELLDLAATEVRRLCEQ